MAHLAGVSSGVTSHLETGKRPNPSADTLGSIAKVLGARLDWLWFGEGEAPTPEQAAEAVKVARKRAQRRDRQRGAVA